MTYRALTLLTVALAACSSEPAPGERGAPDAAAAASTARPDAPAEPAASLGNPLSFTAPGDWIESPPSSSMRVAQYQLPGEDPGAEAELVIYYFGTGQGGSREANLERWATQFSQPDGSDTLDGAAFLERKVRGMPVHEVSMTGTYVAETSPGSGERVDHPDWSMLAAILESDHGPYYVKLTGPAATVLARTGEFRAFVSGVR